MFTICYTVMCIYISLVNQPVFPYTHMRTRKVGGGNAHFSVHFLPPLSACACACTEKQAGSRDYIYMYCIYMYCIYMYLIKLEPCTLFVFGRVLCLWIRAQWHGPVCRNVVFPD